MACSAADRPPTSTIAALVAAMVLVLLPSGVARAHGGIVPQPVVEEVPALDGLRVTGLVTVAPQLLVENASGTAVTFLDDDGRPWLRISPRGVEADLTVRRWWVANDPRGRGQDPPADAPAGWTRITDEPSFGWFPPALRPPTGADDDHRWVVDVLVGDRPATIEGTLREVEVQGRWTTRLAGGGDLGGARLAAVSGTVPALVVQRDDAAEVTVLGAEGEPMLRLGAAGLEANLASPTWHQHARWDTGTPEPTVDADPGVPPRWEVLSPTGRVATWLEPRGATGQVVPAGNDASDQRLPFEVTIVVDGEPVTARLVTTWEGQDVPVGPPGWVAPAAAVLGAGLLAGAVARRRRRGG